MHRIAACGAVLVRPQCWALANGGVPRFWLRPSTDFCRPRSCVIFAPTIAASCFLVAQTRPIGPLSVLRSPMFTVACFFVGRVNPVAVSAMKSKGIDIADEFPKPVTADVAEAADIIVSMGCGDQICSRFPSVPLSFYLSFNFIRILIVPWCCREIAAEIRGLGPRGPAWQGRGRGGGHSGPDFRARGGAG